MVCGSRMRVRGEGKLEVNSIILQISQVGKKTQMTEKGTIKEDAIAFLLDIFLSPFNPCLVAFLKIKTIKGIIK